MALTMVSPSLRTTPSDRRTLSATVLPEGTGTAVVLRGEADLASRSVIGLVMSCVIAGVGGDVVVDLSRLECIDSGDLRSLQVARRLLERQGRRFTVRSPSLTATRTLHVLGL